MCSEDRRRMGVIHVVMYCIFCCSSLTASHLMLYYLAVILRVLCCTLFGYVTVVPCHDLLCSALCSGP